MSESPSDPSPLGQDPLVAAGHDDRRVAEIRMFLNGLQERTPQEAIGMSGDGDLMRYLLVAVVASVALAFAGTALPYFWPTAEPATAANKQDTAADSGRQAPETPSETSDATAAGGGKTALTPRGEKVANPDQVLNSLGIGEAKQADPKENPLEDNLDKLLDGVD